MVSSLTTTFALAASLALFDVSSASASTSTSTFMSTLMSLSLSLSLSPLSLANAAVPVNYNPQLMMRNGCKDDPEFLFKDNAKKSCAWISNLKKKKKKRRLCNKNKVRRSCPETCQIEDCKDGNPILPVEVNNNDNDNDNNKDPAENKRVYIPRGRKRKRKRKPKNDPNRTLSPEEKLRYTIPNTAPLSNVSNAVFYRDIPPEYLEPNPDRFLWDRGTDLVTNSKTRIPEWMKDYFRWHRYKRDTWNLTNWESERWLVSQCLADQDSKKCGGTADRLKPVPALLRKAWESKRIYLIRWTRPGLLEEFLTPPEGGFDWRVPEELARVMNDPNNGKRLATRTMINRYASTGLALVRSRFQTDTPNLHYHRWVFGEDNVTESDPNNVPATIDEPDFDSVFPSLWKIAFTPSPPIQTILRNKLNELGLVVNGYVGAHMRALYKVATRPENQQKQFAENALACATELWPDPPLVFLASDSSLVLEHALGLSKSGRHGIPKVVTSAAVAATKVASNNNDTDTNNKKKAEQEQHPLHLDTFVAPIEEFYGTFVDLYLLAMARCVTYGTGGYGHWGMLIGGHTTCTNRQHRIGTRIKNPSRDLCHFPDSAATRVGPLDGVDPPDTVRIFGDDGELGPLLLPPMP